MKRSLKTVVALIASALLVALFILLPSLLTEASDAKLLAERHSVTHASKVQRLTAEAASYPSALALYVSNIHTEDSVQSYPTNQGTETELNELKAAGVVPREYELYDNTQLSTHDKVCVVQVEPVSGVVIDIQFIGGEMDTKELIESFTVYLGLEAVDDWREILVKSEYQTKTAVGRYSPSTLIYISALSDEEGRSRSISVASHTEEEMKPLLENYKVSDEMNTHKIH